MAKRQRNYLITVAFNYLVKTIPNDDDPNDPIEEGFTESEFQRIVNRIRNTDPLDESDPDVISSIKLGRDLPFSYHEEVEPGLHFGNFDCAYYGQRYRNNRLGVVEASDLNLRGFHYLITRLRDGKILIGTSYHGPFGDYDGLRSCLMHLIRGNYKIASKTLKSMSSEIGSGQPVSLKLMYRRASDRLERAPLFGKSGAIAITSSEFGDDFGDIVTDTARQVTGDVQQRRRALAKIVNQAELISLDEADIVGCSAVIREDGRQRTIYFLGENSFSTKFPLRVSIDVHGEADRDSVKSEMIRVMRHHITPLLRDVRR